MTFAVLAVSFLIEGSVLIFAIREVRKAAGGEPFFRFVRQKADPAVVAILLEDGAAVLGLVLAVIGIVLAWATGNALFDSIASLLVGLLLGVVAIYLVRENRELLLGKAVPQDVEETFVRVVSSHPGIRDVHDIKTRQLTPEAYKLKAEIRLDQDALCGALDQVLPASISGPERAQVLRALSGRAVNYLCDKVEEIERAVRAEIPAAIHIDLELDRADGPAVP